MTKFRGEVGAVAALVVAPMAVPTSAVASDTPEADAGTHCVVETAPLDDLARGARTEPRCYSTVTELLRANGLAGALERSIGIDEATQRFAGAGFLAYHYVDAHGGGASLAVSGTCGGSGLSPLPPGFNDQVSSTRHLQCGRIKHFSDANGGGDHQITTGAFNAVVNMNGLLNDRVTSTFYYAS
jgi:hypothetical protein